MQNRTDLSRVRLRPGQCGNPGNHGYFHPLSHSNVSAAGAGVGFLARWFGHTDHAGSFKSAETALTEDRAQASRLLDSLRIRVSHLQWDLDSVGGIERCGAGDGAGVLFGGFHRAAGMVAAERTAGLDQAAGGGVQPGWLRVGGGRAQPGCLADQPGGYPDRTSCPVCAMRSTA